MKSRAYAFWHFMLCWLARLLFFIIPHGVKNEPRIKDGPYIVCSNHTSAVDPIIICACTRRQQPRFMAKAELFKKPVLGKMISGLGAYPVDRSGRDAGVLMRSIKMLEEGYCIGMFPQGTRRPGVDPETTPVRNGIGMICSHSRATVLPVFIKTRKNRVRPFSPVRVYVGRPVSWEEYTDGGRRDDSASVSRYVFSKICELGGRKYPPVSESNEDNQS